MLRLACCFIGVFFLSGCSEPLASLSEDYLQRISRVTGESLYDARDSTELGQPDSSLFSRLPLVASSVTLLDFLKLQSCSLAQTLGYKNSQLGKVASPSQQMHLERDILIHLPDCITQIKDAQPELADTLQQALQLKQQQRMKVWWNAWFSDVEWQHYRSGSGQTIEQGGDEPGHLSAGLVALDYAIEQGHGWQQQNYAYDSQRMELELQQLLLAESLGRWRNSLNKLTAMLNQAAQLLEQTQARQTLCRQGVEQREATYLKNVFQQKYVAVIQPYLARVYRFGNELMPRLQRLQELTPEQPDYSNWLTNLVEQKQDFELANKRHVKAWQSWLAECGAMPDRTNGNP